MKITKALYDYQLKKIELVFLWKNECNPLILSEIPLEVARLVIKYGEFLPVLVGVILVPVSYGFEKRV